MAFKIDKVSLEDIELMDEIKEMYKRCIDKMKRPIERYETFDNCATPSLFECALCKWECDDTYVCDKLKYCPGCGRRIVKVMVIEDTEEGDSDEK